MRIVHICDKDCLGGAEIACLRHCEAMLASGWDASMMVVEKRSDKTFVKLLIHGIELSWHRVFCHLHNIIARKINATGLFSVMRFGHDISRLDDIYQADVIFLHWVNGNTLSLRDVKRVLQLGKPTFWFMHDMFPITGGCHYSMGCEGYRTTCSSCPLIGNTTYKWIAQKQLKQKISRWSKYQNLSFVTPSHWLAGLVSASKVAAGRKVFVVPNLIDTQVYKPLPFTCKTVFGLDLHKKTLLFGAASMKSVYKGTQILHSFLKMLDPEKYEGLIIGEKCEDIVKDVNITVKSIGFLSDDYSRVMAYNACDTVVITSVAENYPNMVLEAMACGKPCVGFNTGGIPELINHGETGFITPDKTAEELARWVDKLFSDKTRYLEMSAMARKQIEEVNSYKRVRQVYRELL